MAFNERCDPSVVQVSIRAQKSGGCLHAWFEGNSAAVVEEMDDRHRRPDPLQSMFFELKPAQERRSHRQRMDRGTDIMQESRQGQLRGARATSRCRMGLENGDAQARSRQDDTGGEAIRTGTDDSDIERHSGLLSTLLPGRSGKDLD